MSDFNQGPEVISPPPPAPAAGLSENAAGALAYVTIIPAILFLILEPYNRNPFIRFHSFQCIGLAIVGIAGSVVAVIPIIGWIIGILLMPILLVAWLICIVKASQGKMFKLPIVGNIVENMAR